MKKFFVFFLIAVLLLLNSFLVCEIIQMKNEMNELAWIKAIVAEERTQGRFAMYGETICWLKNESEGYWHVEMPEGLDGWIVSP